MTATQRESLSSRWSPTVVPCKEYGPIEVPMEEIVGPDGRLAIMPGILGHYARADFKANEIRLSALGVTGLVPLTDRMVAQVAPRFPLRNLTHMVNACGYSPTVISALRTYRPTDTWADWVIDVLADGLLTAIETIARNGMLRSYHRRTEVSSYPHGRIDATQTALRIASRGILHRAQYSWFERTVDNPPNRCLKCALNWLHDHYRKMPRRAGVRERSLRIAAGMRLLNEASLESRPISLEDDQVRGQQPLPETRSYYQPALELAVAILTGRGVDLDTPGGGLSLPSLLVRTDNVFEQFVRLSLQEAFGDDSDISVLDGNKDAGRLPLYEDLTQAEIDVLPHDAIMIPSSAGSDPSAEPDIVFRLNTAYPLIADVKYTNVKQHADRSEVEQIVLYGMRYKSPVVMTIHPKRHDSRAGLHVSGRIGETLVCQYRMDLAAENLDDEMETMAECFRALIHSGGFPAST